MEEKTLTISFSKQLHINELSSNTLTSCLNESKSIPLKEGMSLYHTLKKEGIAFSAPCGGKGTCGACKIRVLEGNVPVTEKDRGVFSKEQLIDGWRLACQAYPTEDCVAVIPVEKWNSVTGYVDTSEKNGKDSSVEDRDVEKTSISIDDEVRDSKETYAIAIDLGTTTLAYELFSLRTGKTIHTISSVNPQRMYGADVVSRMEQSNNGRSDMLKNILRQEMRKDIRKLCNAVGDGESNRKKIAGIAISGNTAMVHLFMGYSCEGLGRYPFAPVTLESIRTDGVHTGITENAIPVWIMSGISAYVGGDILSGIAAKQMVEEETPSLFLDLGTNAEMVLNDGKGNLYVTSAPAGPAFEAANISCGVGSIEGAISGISICGTQQEVTTIGGKEPVGFCGSGILEAVYELLRNNLIDETGLLTDEYFESGYPIFRLKITQQDIRQIQLAKAAVFSAIQILMKKADVAPHEIERIYLAGGFGYHLNINKAAAIGLFPQKFTDNIQSVGNTSLYGAKEFLLGNISNEQMIKIKDSCQEVYLSNEEGFQKIFMENMNFLK